MLDPVPKKPEIKKGCYARSLIQPIDEPAPTTTVTIENLEKGNQDTVHVEESKI